MIVKGSISFPGDKSISHRALMIAALSSDRSIIKNLSNGADVKSTEKCLQQCGILIERLSNNTITLNGKTFTDPKTDLDCGNSGTTIRLLAGLLAGQKINARFIGDNSLSNRPMDRIVKPLSEMSLDIQSNSGKLPISIKRSDIRGIDYKNKISSAQVKSAVLFCGLGAEGMTNYYEPVQSRDHTEIMLKNVGIDIARDKNKVRLNKLKKNPKGLNITIPGDPSTAAFFAGAAVLVPDSEITLNNILANPTRFEFFNTIRNMGVKIDVVSSWNETGESVKNIKVKSSTLEAIKIGKDKIPGLIDEIPILSIIATQAMGTTEIRDAKELRVKESDRIKSIIFNLKNMGASVEEYDDGFSIHGPTPLKGAKIKTYNDHRIAMAFTVAGLIAKGTTTLDNTKCVDISFPDFFKLLESVVK
jgi:3-phosphoshikimate 1-carboxyvinyltransferase